MAGEAFRKTRNGLQGSSRAGQKPGARTVLSAEIRPMASESHTTFLLG